MREYLIVTGCQHDKWQSAKALARDECEFGTTITCVFELFPLAKENIVTRDAHRRELVAHGDIDEGKGRKDNNQFHRCWEPLTNRT